MTHICFVKCTKQHIRRIKVYKKHLIWRIKVEKQHV